MKIIATITMSSLLMFSFFFIACQDPENEDVIFLYNSCSENIDTDEEDLLIEELCPLQDSSVIKSMSDIVAYVEENGENQNLCLANETILIPLAPSDIEIIGSKVDTTQAKTIVVDLHECGKPNSLDFFHDADEDEDIVIVPVPHDLINSVKVSNEKKKRKDRKNRQLKFKKNKESKKKK